jgi:hypothetical protein
MSSNPRNIDNEDLGSTRGGIGTHATNRNQAASAERDNTAAGREGHRADPMASSLSELVFGVYLMGEVACACMTASDAWPQSGIHA